MIKGKKGIVIGIANDHSIAWGIAKQLHASGAQLAITYQNNTLLKRVKPLADKVNSDILVECDVNNEEHLQNTFTQIKKTFGEDMPKISSTKSLTGHSLGATGVHEAIYCLLMMNNNFLCGSANINNLDSKALNHNILFNTEHNVNIENIISNSFGFGGTNATLLMSKYHD